MGNKKMKKGQTTHDSIIDSSDTEMVTLRIGGKWQSMSKELLNQARQVMKTLTPMEQKVLQMYFGLPDEYFEECD